MNMFGGEETTESKRAVGPPQGYTTRRGVWDVSVTFRCLGLFRKGRFRKGCGGIQYWILFFVLMILILFTDYWLC